MVSLFVEEYVEIGNTSVPETKFFVQITGKLNENSIISGELLVSKINNCWLIQPLNGVGLLIGGKLSVALTALYRSSDSNYKRKGVVERLES